MTTDSLPPDDPARGDAPQDDFERRRAPVDGDSTFLERILAFSVKRRWYVLAGSLAVAVVAARDLANLPIDAIPDLTNVQVQVNTEAPGYSPEEVEQQLTFPVENALAGLPKLEQTRSLSRYGLSQVTVIFEDGTDLHFARQLVGQRLGEVASQLPAGIEATMGPIATGLGEISQFILEADPRARKADGTPWTLTDLRTILDWQIKPRLRRVPGVTEVNSIGGHVQQIHVHADPERLLARGLVLHDVVAALEGANATRGAGYLERRGEQLVVRTPGRLASAADIEAVVVGNDAGVPVRIRDVADIAEGGELRVGAATAHGEEAVFGTAVMLVGSNSREVASAVAEAIAELNTSLPTGVSARLAYDRTHLVDRTIRTVSTSLVEGALLVIAVLFLMLGNWRAGLIPAAVIPLAMLMAASAMRYWGISGSLMSLGAIDFGLIVDGAVIIVENCVRRLGEEQRRVGRPLVLRERLAIAIDASREVRRATMFGELIIMIVYLPVLTLGGLEGKMFFPMAFTVLCALAGAMLLSVTFVPAAVAVLLRGPFAERDSPAVRGAQTLYDPTLRWSLRHRGGVAVAALAATAAGLVLSFQLGREFMPRLDEGDILMHAIRPTSTALGQAVEMQKSLDRKLETVPEVQEVFARIGTGDIATDPMPPNIADTFVILKPREQWENPRKTRDELVEELEELVATEPGQNYEFTQPIEMRFNELIAGVRTDLAVKVFGDDMEQLRGTAEKVAAVLEQIDGAADVRVEPVSGLPTLSVEPDRNAMARYGVSLGDLQETVEIAIGGKRAGQIVDGDRRFAIVVRTRDDVRENTDRIARLPVPVARVEGDQAPDHFDERRASRVGARDFVPLSSVAKLEIAEGPNQITRENGKRRVVVTANVRGRDLGSFVEEARTRVNSEVRVPEGDWITWGGDFEQLLSATARLRIVVPVALGLILLLLLASFGNLRDALLVFSGVPLALTGGVVTLWLRDLPLSIPAAVGFIALSGVAVLNGLVMLSRIRALREEGLSVEDAAYRGATSRLRPVLMTALVAALGFVPMALATGAGSEVQRPLATVVVGGVVTAMLLTLVVLPGMYVSLHRR
jgi:cobalt-zinc-cadmium resistance protein CzcA